MKEVLFWNESIQIFIMNHTIKPVFYGFIYLRPSGYDQKQLCVHHLPVQISEVSVQYYTSAGCSTVVL